jgi:ion channel
MPEAPAVASEMSRRPGEPWSRFAERVASAFGLVLLLVLATYALLSLTSYKDWPGVVTALVSSASAVVALASAGTRHAVVRWAGRLAVVAVGLQIVAVVSGSGGVQGASALLQVGLLSVAALAVLRAVLSESQVGFRTILGAVSVYLVLAIQFAYVYVFLEKVQGGPFFANTPKLQTGDYMFFSITTLTTTGYGNLVPAGQPGKMISGFEMFTGQLFVVTLIAGLVSLWVPGKRVREMRHQREGDGDGDDSQ